MTFGPQGPQLLPTTGRRPPRASPSTLSAREARKPCAMKSSTGLKSAAQHHFLKTN